MEDTMQQEFPKLHPSIAVADSSMQKIKYVHPSERAKKVDNRQNSNGSRSGSRMSAAGRTKQYADRRQDSLSNSRVEENSEIISISVKRDT